jgi:hypothetical protein
MVVESDCGKGVLRQEAQGPSNLPALEAQDKKKVFVFWFGGFGLSTLFFGFGFG